LILKPTSLNGHQLGDIRLTRAPRQSSSAEQLAAKNGYELAKFFC
jgi:hypothetical protein